MQIFALGIVSIFDQVLDEMSAEERDSIFKAYIGSLDEEPDKYRKDADKLTEMAEACSSPDDLIPDANGSEVRSRLRSLQRVGNPPCYLPICQTPLSVHPNATTQDCYRTIKALQCACAAMLARSRRARWLRAPVSVTATRLFAHTLLLCIV